MQLTILMPCLNEAETLGACIRKANAWIARSGIEAEVVIADNGSTDGSQALAQSLGARVVQVAQRGYGAALFHGSLAAKGEWIIMGDSDDSYDFSALDPFVARLGEGYDLVMGNRFLGGIAPGAMPWKNRYVGNPVLSWIGRVLFGCPARDFHCGLRGFRKDAFLRMDQRTTGMEYASEMADQGDAVWHAHLRGADDAVEGWTLVGGLYNSLAGVARRCMAETRDENLVVVSVPLPPSARSGVRLGRPAPNPLRGTDAIAFDLPAPTRVTLELLDVQGRRVRTLVAGEARSAGRHQVALDATSLRPGRYVARLRTPDGEAATPVVVISH